MLIAFAAESIKIVANAYETFTQSLTYVEKKIWLSGGTGNLFVSSRWKSSEIKNTSFPITDDPPPATVSIAAIQLSNIEKRSGYD